MTPIRRHVLAAAAPLVAALLGSALPAAAQPPAPRVEGAWARTTVPGQAVGGGFLTITGGAAPDRLVGASATAVARAVELHMMAMEGDVMRMREVPGIDIPAGGTVELKPGGLHLMFVGLARPLAAGTRFPLTLRFEKAGAVQVDVPVAASQPPKKAGG